MNSIFEYLISVSVCSTVLYLSYLLFFSRDTFYMRNRIFLLSILLLPVFIPAITLLLPGGYADPVKSQGMITTIIVAGNQVDSTLSGHFKMASLNKLILLVYLIIGAFLLFRSVYGVIKALRIIKKGREVDGGFPRVVLSDSNEHLFSFFPFIVVPEKMYNNDEYSEILEHERVHVRQLHTFDLLLSEFCVSLQWFNPFIWFIKRSIVLNHEYLADNISIIRSQNKTAYQYKLLNLSVQSAEVSLTHNFTSSIKKRLIMINKRPTKSYAALKGFLFIPVVAVLFLFFAFRSAPVTAESAIGDTIFSKTSMFEIYKFISTNILYPEEAKVSGDTGSFYVLVKMGRGGVVKECSVVTDPAKIDAPLLDEIVVVGYKSPTSGVTSDSKDHKELQSECLRIANKFGAIEIPEWKDKNMAFILNFKFTLK